MMYTINILSVNFAPYIQFAVSCYPIDTEIISNSVTVLFTRPAWAGGGGDRGVEIHPMVNEEYFPRPGAHFIEMQTR